MQKGDFFAALLNSVNIDDYFDFCLDKVQYDRKNDEFLVHFKSNFLPAKKYLLIEEYIKKTMDKKAKLFIAYQDIESVDGEGIETHVKELCCDIKRSLIPFVVSSKMYFKENTFHIDFADDFGKELFLTSGLKEYLGDYFLRCFGRQVRIMLGRHNEGKSLRHKLAEVERDLLQDPVSVPEKAPQKAPEAAPKKNDERAGAKAGGDDSRETDIRRFNADQGPSGHDRNVCCQRRCAECQIV